MTDGRRRAKRTLDFVFCAFFSLLCFAASPHQVSAQGYDLSNDEFSVKMPEKPEYDREFAQTYPNYHAYRVNVGDVHYFILLIVRNSSARKGYEYQALTLKGHSIGYNAGLKRASERDGISVDVTFDRELRLNGFPGRQFRIVSSDGPGLIRFYSTDRCLYTLQVRGATEQDRAVKAFFDSFKLVRRPTNDR
jgi:hypothetical protein